jgi:hypothetical protein
VHCRRPCPGSVKATINNIKATINNTAPIIKGGRAMDRLTLNASLHKLPCDPGEATSSSFVTEAIVYVGI